MSTKKKQPKKKQPKKKVRHANRDSASTQGAPPRSGSGELGQSLAALRRAIEEDDDFSRTYRRFLRITKTSARFNALGEPFTDPQTTAILEHAAEYLEGQAPSASQPMLFRLAEFGFVHGVFVTNKRQYMVIYFEGADRGLISSVGTGGRVDYLRFRPVIIPIDGPAPILGRDTGEIN